jgi:hypothetical protein
VAAAVRTMVEPAVALTEVVRPGMVERGSGPLGPAAIADGSWELATERDRAEATFSALDPR